MDSFTLRCPSCGKIFTSACDRNPDVCHYCGKSYDVADALANYYMHMYDENLDALNKELNTKPDTFAIANGVLTKYNGSDALVIIPDNVKKIGKEAFSCSRIRSVVIPDSVTEIEDAAFMNCQELVKLSLPSRLQRIGKNAFRQCEKLKELTLPAGVLVDEGAFERCLGLTELSIPSKATVRKSAFLSCKSLRQVSICPDARLEPECFFMCRALSSIKGAENFSDDCFVMTKYWGDKYIPGSF